MTHDDARACAEQECLAQARATFITSPTAGRRPG